MKIIVSSFSRNLVLLFAMIFAQSSLGTKAVMLESQNLGQNGYVKFSNGLLIQWGQRTGSSVSGLSVYLPTSFFNTQYIIQGSVVKVSSDNAVYVALPLLNPTVSSFKIDRNYANGQFGTTTGAFNWFAIGRWK